RRRHANAGDRWHAELHGPRTSGRFLTPHRPRRGRVFTRCDPVRTADGPPALSWRVGAGHARPVAHPRPDSADALAAQGATRPRNDLPEVPAQGLGPALRHFGGIGGRPRAFPAARTNPGSADGCRGPDSVMVQAQARAGRILRERVRQRILYRLRRFPLRHLWVATNVARKGTFRGSGLRWED